MNHLNMLALSFLLAISMTGSLAAPAMNMENSIKDLYDYLLNREYADPLALEHQMERKAVRSPSLRLRFGRRSDPDVLLRVTISRHNYLSFISFVYFIFKQDNEIDNEVEQKPIRSPSLRLRFGKRFGNDPMMSLFNEDMLARKAQRAPSVRLRFGRSDPSLRDNELNTYHSDDSVLSNQVDGN
ncbi:unnamed protein product [Diamesa hyperborea]